ncbi:hypothetical protein [Aeromonas sp. Marseille-Q7275]
MDLFLLFGLLAMGVTLYAVRFWDRRYAHPDWQRLPTRAEYLSTHPERTTDGELEARCCGKILFRTEEPRCIPYMAYSLPICTTAGCKRLP